MSRIVRISRWPLIALVVALLAILGYRVTVFDADARAAILPMALFYTPTENEVLSALHRAGLDAESLAVSGVASEEVADVVADVAQYLTNNPGTLSSADDAYGDARAEHTQLVRHVRTGMATTQEIADLATASTTLASAAAARDAAVEALFDAGTDSLDQDEGLLLEMLSANREDWHNLPVEFLTIQRTETEWLALRNALAEERIVNAGGEGAGPDGELSSASQTLLSNARSHTTVANAISSLNTNLAAIENAIAAAVASEGE